MNIRSIYLAGLFAIIGSHIINTNAQQLRNPCDFPILLSGNFGELRSNHFHSGIDFKTQGVEGKPVHTVQEGYVSRISVSPWGYGNGLYHTRMERPPYTAIKILEENSELCKRATIRTRKFQCKSLPYAGFASCREK